MRYKFLIIFLLSGLNSVLSQNKTIVIDYNTPKKYIIGGVYVTGNDQIDKSIIISYSGLVKGATINIPGDEIVKAMGNLWKQKLFSDVKIIIDKIEGEKIYLTIVLKTRPRLTRYSFHGVSKKQADKIREKISLKYGEILSDQLLQNTKNQIQKFFIEKGYYSPIIKLEQEPDTAMGKSGIQLKINIDEGKRTRIKEIIITGNEQVKTKKIKRLLKKTKQYEFWNVFRSSKFISEDFADDKQKIIDYYNSIGLRDARILKDTVYLIDNQSLGVQISLFEGKKYFFRNISWAGNSKYNTKFLNNTLGMRKGDVYNLNLLEQKLEFSPNGIDIKSLYMDNGYLFCNIKPVETLVENDSIDIELRIYEGPQAIINKVNISGNTKTSDHVILREIRSRPGQIFSRSDIIRSQRELATLNYFDPEQINIMPNPHPEDGTVDIDYKLVEKPSDQFQLQGGWGNGQFVGSIGVKFTNFSARKLFDFSEWKPLPSGDGQTVGIQFQSNALYYSSVNLSFTDPWFGGKKPNQFTTSIYYSIQTNGVSSSDPSHNDIRMYGASIGLGKRLKVPDDYFTLYNEITFQKYFLNNYTTGFIFTNGEANNLSFKHVLQRNSIDQPIYPRSGSQITFSLQWTPPYSSITGRDYTNATLQEKYNWIEFYKWEFNESWFLNIIGKLVLNTKIQYGFLGYYNKQIGVTPFNRFYLGGDGLSGYSLIGRELIGLRGYQNNSLSPTDGASIFNKYTLELRYPISLNPQATVYILGFGDAGNSWTDFQDFNPFKLYRSLGVGVRIFMPYFGLLGCDWGYGFDKVPNTPSANGSNFAISIGQQF